ncbi:polysaccharide deacetylase family protein [Sporosarcina soli]|uniref:Polysaccharide deacetylase family protein n=1 Tax=Sporosarcina soli TaxID=334736 RepID=A0ABW0TN81_9BACL
MKRTHRKRRSLWIDATFSIAIITLTVAAIYLISLTSKNDEASSTGSDNRTKPSPVIIDTTDSNYPGIKIITETSNDLFSPFAIQYPQSIHNHFNEEISAYIKKAKQDYLAKMEEEKKLGNDTTGELNISFETLLHPSDHYSFVLINSSSIGGVDGVTEIRSFHLNPDSGAIITIEDVLNHDLNNLEQITNLVRDALYNDPSLKENLSLEDAHRYTEPIWENYRNFAITDESLIFYFDEHIVASDTAGPPIVAISLQDVNEWVAKGFKLHEPSTDIVDNVETDDVMEKNDGHGQKDHTPDSDKSSAKDEESKDDSTETGSESTVDTDKTVDTTDTIDSTDSTVKRVALTFDDGPDPKVTMQILDILKKYDAKATFFMLGSRVEYYPEIAKHVADARHELGNHTWNHPDLTKAGVEKVRNEINRTSSIIEEVTGVKPTAFRPPYGAVNKTVRAQTDLPIVLWDVDTLDWKHRDPEKLLANVKSAVKDGSIILMHDIHQSTADGLDAVLAYLQSEGFIFVTVSELE